MVAGTAATTEHLAHLRPDNALLTPRSASVSLAAIEASRLDGSIGTIVRMVLKRLESFALYSSPLLANASQIFYEE
jgi:hypothetical protein